MRKLSIKYFLIPSCLFFVIISAFAQRSASACLVAEFRSIAYLTHDIEQRIAKINDWIKQKGASCTPSQLAAIASNRATWLGSADTVAISSSIDGLLEAKIKDDPDLMARMYSSKGKDFKPSLQVTQPPPAPAPVVPPPAPEMGAVGSGGPVIVQMQSTQQTENKKVEVPDESFTSRQKREIKEFYEENRGSDECPKGMTKRGANCESRFQERDWKLGQPLPASERAEDLPLPLTLKLGKPPSEHQYKRLGVDILMLKGPEKKVTDAVLNLGGIKPKEDKTVDPATKK